MPPKKYLDHGVVEVEYTLHNVSVHSTGTTQLSCSGAQFESLKKCTTAAPVQLVGKLQRSTPSQAELEISKLPNVQTLSQNVEADEYRVMFSVSAPTGIIVHPVPILVTNVYAYRITAVIPGSQAHANGIIVGDYVIKYALTNMFENKKKGIPFENVQLTWIGPPPNQVLNYMGIAGEIVTEWQGHTHLILSLLRHKSLIWLIQLRQYWELAREIKRQEHANLFTFNFTNFTYNEAAHRAIASYSYATSATSSFNAIDIPIFVAAIPVIFKKPLPPE